MLLIRIYVDIAHCAVVYTLRKDWLPMDFLATTGW